MSRTAITDVPFVDLAPSHLPLKERLLERIAETIDRGDFLNGEAVAEFERRFARYTGAQHCVAVSSGLDALRLALIGAGVGRDAGVIVPAHTFAATFEAVIQAGGKPVVVDISESDYNLDVDQTSRAAEHATHVLPVHLYGQMANMRELARIADARALQIVEDACQAHGARRDGVTPGLLSRAAAFSFYPAKNLGAMGDAGALVTGDSDLSSLARALRAHGETRKYHHDHVGYTARLDTIQAVVLIEKLPLLEDWNRQRRDAADRYRRALAGLETLTLPLVPAGSEPVWHLFVVRVPDRDALARFLAARGIATGRHYPEPPHLTPAYAQLGFARGDFPVAEALARDGLSLPLYPGITPAQIDWVCESIHAFFG